MRHEEEQNEIGARLEEVIYKFCNGNNSEFARKIGVSESTIRNYLTLGNIRADVIAKIADCYEVDVEWLILGKSSKINIQENNVYNGSRNVGNNNIIHNTCEDKEKELLDILKSTQTELHKIIEQQQEQLTKAQEQISLLLNLLHQNTPK